MGWPGALATLAWSGTIKKSRSLFCLPRQSPNKPVIWGHEGQPWSVGQQPTGENAVVTITSSLGGVGVLDNFISQARPVRLVSVPLHGGVGELEDIFLTKPLRSPSQTLPARTPQLPSRVSSEKEAPSASRSWASTSTGQNQAQPQPHPCPHIPSHSRS